MQRTGLAERHVVHFSPVLREEAVGESAEEDAGARARGPKPVARGPLGIAASELADWILADRLPVRLNLQLHVCIYGRGRRGV